MMVPSNLLAPAGVSCLTQLEWPRLCDSCSAHLEESCWEFHQIYRCSSTSLDSFAITRTVYIHRKLWTLGTWVWEMSFVRLLSMMVGYASHFTALPTSTAGDVRDFFDHHEKLSFTSFWY